MGIAYVSATSEKAAEFSLMLNSKGIFEASVSGSFSTLVVAGGDGTMLRGIHEYAMVMGIPVYGVNCGTVGFLMNDYSYEDIRKRIAEAIPVQLPLLKMRVIDIDGTETYSHAVNEVSLFRSTNSTCRLNVIINGAEMIKGMVSDGIMVSTPAGSTAYNSSAGGPIIPLCSLSLVVTAINSFRPKHWKSAILPSSADILINIQDPITRPVSAVADYKEVRNVLSVHISQDKDKFVTLLFDKERNLHEKIIREQFF